jgi:hypothetical protein
LRIEQFRLSKEFRQRTSGSRRSLAFNLLIRFQNRGGMRINEEDRASEEDTASQIGARAAGGRTRWVARVGETAIGEGDANGRVEWNLSDGAPLSCRQHSLGCCI